MRGFFHPHKEPRMTFSAIPFALQNAAHSAALFRQATSSLVPPGGGLVTTGDLAVTQTGTPSMNVSIGVGRCWIPGTNVGNVVGGNFSSQAMYYGQNESAYTASVTTSDPINPRIDIVYAAVQDSQYAGTTNTGVLAVVAGVPTSGAAYPANAPAIPANAIALAYIVVAANATSIVNANITRLANPYDRKYVEFVSTAPFNISGGSVSWDVGPLSVDPTRQFNNTFANSAGAISGSINITESGVYAITSNTIGVGSPGNAWISMHLGNTEIIYTGNTTGYAWEISTAATVYIPAGSYIRWVAQYTNSVTSCITRVRLTKVSG